MASKEESKVAKHSNAENEVSNEFNIQLLYDSLEKCCENSNALDMKQYLLAFKELYRFFSLLGSVFSFVASDISSKVCILESYLQSPSCDNYATIQSMIDHESSNNNILNNSKEPSGSRTLLRLHRSLQFIMTFMHDFSTAESSAKSSAIAQKCYKDTLAKYHPWLIQKGACLAMYSLPRRQQFIERVHGGPCDEDVVLYYSVMMGAISAMSEKIYDETHKLYEANGLLDLP